MKYFIYKLRTLKVHIVLMCVFAAASYPLFSTALSNYFAAEVQYKQLMLAGYSVNSPEVEAANKVVWDAQSTVVFIGIIGAIALIAMFTTGIPILTKCFGYLTKKPLADMEMTAPVTVATRFFGSFFAGLAVYLVPHIIAAVIGWLAMGTSSGVRVVDNASESYRRMMIYGLMMCVLFYCSTALIIAVCGRIKTAVVTTLFMNFAVPAVTIFAGEISFGYGYGLSTGLADEMFERVGWFSPLGLLIKYLAQGVFGTKASGLVGIPHILLFMLYCAAFVAAAYFLVKNRRHEKTGKAFVYNNARHVVSATAVLAVTLIIFSYAVIANLHNMAWMGVAAGTVAGIIAVDAVLWLLTSFGFFCACEFGDSKGEKDRKKRFGLFAPFILGSAAVTFALTFTQGFGAAYYVPEPDNIDTIRLTVEVGDMYFGATYYDKEIYGEIFEDGKYGSDFLDEQPDPSEIIGLHKDIIAGGKGSDGEVSISYKLKNGVASSRKYNVSEEYLKRAFAFTATPDFEPWELEGISKNKYVKVGLPNHYPDDNVQTTSAEIPTEEFIKAIKDDCSSIDFYEAKSMNAHSAIENSYLWVYYTDGEYDKYNYGFTITVNKLFPRMIDLLEQYGIPRDELFEQTD